MANEKRNLIDRDDLIDSLGVSDMEIFAKEVIGDATTVDAVEVVRCKDCKNYFYSSVSMGMRCRLDGTEWRKDDFCSCGERKDYGGNKTSGASL